MPIVCCLLFFWSSTFYLLQAQTVRGTVVDKNTQLPIEGAVVQLLDYDRIIIDLTDEAGRFELMDIPDGKHRLAAEAAGHEPAIYPFETHQTQRIWIEMVPLLSNNPKSVAERWNPSVTTASQKAERLINVPATTHVVTAQEIQERGYTTLTDVLEDIPEIEIQHKADGLYANFITIRGVQGNERFLVLLDGMRITAMATTRHAIDQNYWMRYAERIEVVLVPSSALYGADAFTGVINIISKKGADHRGGEAQGSYGMYQTTENGFYLGFGKPQCSVALSGGFYHSAEPNLSRFYPQAYAWYNEQYHINGNLLVGPSALDTVQLPPQPFAMPRMAYYGQAVLHRKNLQLGVVHHAQTHSSAMGNEPAYAPPMAAARYGIAVTNAFVQHQLADPQKRRWRIQSALNWNFYTLKTDSRFINSVSNYQKAYKYGFNHNIKLRELFSYQLHRQHSILVGFSTQYTHALPKTSDLPRPYRPLVPASTQGYVYLGTDIEDKDGNDLSVSQDFYYLDQYYGGVFLQYQGNFNDGLMVTVGGRFDYSLSQLRGDNSSQTYGDFNPRVGLVWRPVEVLRFRLFYREAFLAPSPEKRFEHYGSVESKDSSGAVVGLRSAFWRLPNPDLAPEKVRSAEFSTTFVNREWVLGLGAYYNQLTDLVTTASSFSEEFRGIDIREVERLTNTANAYTYGGSFRALWQHYFNAARSTKLELYTSYAYSQGRFNDSLPLPFSAAHTIKAGATLVVKRFSIHTRGLWRTATINARGTGNPAFWVLQAYANCRVVQTRNKAFGIDVFVRVRNLLDARYFNTTLSNPILLRQVPQDPIRVTAGLRLVFDAGQP